MQKLSKSELTILIPSYERHNSLKRTIEYFSEQGLHTMVVDGSSENLKKKWTIPKNCNYHSMPDTDNIRAMGNYADRIRFAANTIKTKYVLHCNDDERRIISGIEAAIQMLEEDFSQEFVACAAPVVNLSISGKKFNLSAKNSNILSLSGSLFSEKASTRLNALSTNYAPVAHFSVMRTDAWKKSIEVTFAHEPYVFAFAEIILEVSLASFGRFLYSEIPIVLRSTIENKIPRKKKIVRICDWWQTQEGIKVLKNIENLIKKNVPLSRGFKSLRADFLHNWIESYIYTTNTKSNKFFNFFLRLVRKINSEFIGYFTKRRVKCNQGAKLYLQSSYTELELLGSRELCEIVDSYVSRK